MAAKGVIELKNVFQSSFGFVRECVEESRESDTSINTNNTKVQKQ